MLIGYQGGRDRTRDIVRVYRRGAWPRRGVFRQAGFLALGLCLLILACGLACSRRSSPQAAFDHAYKALLHGDLEQAQEEAHRECQRFRDSSPQWALKFRTLEARAALQRGLYEDALKLLKAAPPPSDQPDLAIPILTLEGDADLETHNFLEAER